MGQGSGAIASVTGPEPAAGGTVKSPAWFLDQGWLFGLLLVAATLLAYLPGLRGACVWDDDAWTSNATGLLSDSSGLGLMWCKLGALQQYYPLTGTTFWLDHQFWARVSERLCDICGR